MSNYTDIRDEYLTAIETFHKDMNRIDNKHHTHAVVNIDHKQVRPMQVHGREDPPARYMREITIEAILVQGEPDGINGGKTI